MEGRGGYLLFIVNYYVHTCHSEKVELEEQLAGHGSPPPPWMLGTELNPFARLSQNAFFTHGAISGPGLVIFCLVQEMGLFRGSHRLSLASVREGEKRAGRGSARP